MQSPDCTRERGRSREDAAVRFLMAGGLEILDRNVELSGAELDVIARDHDTIVFVEVRSRHDDLRGHPIATVDARKRAQIVRAAKAWLVANELWDRAACRFDVVGITDEPPTTTWLRDAFDTTT